MDGTMEDGFAFCKKVFGFCEKNGLQPVAPRESTVKSKCTHGDPSIPQSMNIQFLN
jgi:hypothetical protein